MNKNDKAFYTLTESAEWIAFRGNELTFEQKNHWGDYVNAYTETLLATLCSDKVIVKGRKEGDKCNKAIKVRASCELNLQENKIIYNPGTETQFVVGDIQIAANTLRRFFLCNANYNIPYMSPYMEVMFEVVVEMGITKENQPEIRLMEPVVIRRLEAHGRTTSNRQVRSICTLIRMPEAQKGGLRPLDL